jgi:hypothetical protein
VSGARDSHGQFVDTFLNGNDMKERVHELIAFVNNLAVDLGLSPAWQIPTHELDELVMRAFRRSNDYYIQREPGGEIAVAVQNHHRGTVLGRDGYSSAARQGHRRMRSRQENQAHEEMLSVISDEIASGGGVSGPAADEVRALFLNARESRLVLAEETTPVYDVPDQYALCRFRNETAACGGHDEPDAANCQSHCVNRARLDSHAQMMVDDASQLRAEATSPLTPEPLRRRLNWRAERLEQAAAEHFASRATTGGAR